MCIEFPLVLLIVVEIAVVEITYILLGLESHIMRGYGVPD